MSITAPLRIPQLSDIAAGNKAKFDQDVDYYINWQATVLVPGLEEFVGQLNNFATNGSSTSPMTIELGNKSLTADVEKGFLPGMTLRLAARSNPSVWMQGDLQTYSPTTGAFTIRINKIQGEGTFSDWVISPAIAGESLGMGAAVVSSAIPNIWRDDGNKREITGTTAITGFALAPYAGALQWLRFADAVTITASANLILGIPSYTTQAGDWAMVLAETTTQFRVIIVRKDGKALNTGLLAADLPDNVISRRHVANSVKAKIKGFAGYGHDWAYMQMLAVLDDNSALVWGRTLNQALATGSTADVVISPQKPMFNIPIPAGERVIKWEKTSDAVFAVISNGWVYSGGSNPYGNLGHGDTTNRAIMCRIEYFITNDIQITDVVANSSRSTTAVGATFFKNAAGQLWSCGYNYRGELGVGDTSNRSTPTPIPSITGVKKIIVCPNYGPTYLLLNNGKVLGTGVNTRGQLGVGDVINKTSFVEPASLAGLNVVEIAATNGFPDSNWTDLGGHILALTDDGDVFAAGNNGSGQLGLGDVTQRNTFVHISTLSNIVMIGAAGGIYGYSWAVNEDGHLFTWGRNHTGQVGNGTTTAVTAPWLVNQYQRWTGAALETVSSTPPFFGKIAQVLGHCGNALGYGGITVLDTDGVYYLTGYDAYAMSGTNTTNKTRFTAAPVPTMDEPGEKVIELFRCGYDQYETLFACTNRGNLYSAGYNGYTVASAIYNAASSIPGLQKVML